MTRGHLFVVAGMSGLAGGVAGALVTVAVVRSHPAPVSTVEEPRGATDSDVRDSALSARLDAVERSVRALELRRALAERTGSPAPSSSVGAAKAESALVDDPVFEAAVLDVVERAEQGRVSERAARRDERRKVQLDRWADELVRELGLTPAQREKVLQIRQQLSDALRQRPQADGGVELSRRERRAQIEALRGEAEQKLRDVLDGRQMSAYEALDSELKIGRGAR